MKDGKSSYVGENPTPTSMREEIIRIIESMVMYNNADFIPTEDIENCANQIIELNKDIMTIEMKINEDFMKAFKARNTEVKTLLGTVKGEMQTLKKNLMVESLSDEKSIELLNKFAKNMKETIRLTNDESSKSELSIIESYLPKQMSESDINTKLDEIIASGASNIGQIMKAFAGLPVDKKVLSDLAKSKMA